MLDTGGHKVSGGCLLVENEQVVVLVPEGVN